MKYSYNAYELKWSVKMMIKKPEESEIRSPEEVEK